MFVHLLESKDADVQFYCAAALSNLAVHGTHVLRSCIIHIHIECTMYIVHVYIHVYMYIHVCVCCILHTYMYMCMYIHMYMYMYMHVKMASYNMAQYYRPG